MNSESFKPETLFISVSFKIPNRFKKCSSQIGKKMKFCEHNHTYAFTNLGVSHFELVMLTDSGAPRRRRRAPYFLRRGAPSRRRGAAWNKKWSN